VGAASRTDVEASIGGDAAPPRSPNASWVRVVDDQGRGVAGVGIGCYAVPRSNMTWLYPALGARSFTLRSDQEGWVTPQLAGEEARDRFVSLDVVTELWFEARVEPRHGAHDPLQFVLPPTAAVTVRLTDTAGLPVEGDDWLVTMSHWPLPEEGETTVDFLVPQATRKAARGIAEFPHVEPASKLHLLLQCETRGIHRRLEVPGPSEAGGTFELRLEQPPEYRLSLRLLDPQGRPRTYDTCGIRFVPSPPADRGTDWRTARTDREGRLELVVPDHLAQYTPPHSVLEVAIESAERSPSPHALVRLPIPLASGVTELGEVRLRPEPPLVSGTVFDPAGQPLAGAEVQVLSPFNPLLEALLCEGREPLLRSAEPTDAAGRFVVFGRASVNPLVVEVHTPTALTPEGIPFVPGQVELNVPTVAAGSLSLHIVHRDLQPGEGTFSARLVAEGRNLYRALEFDFERSFEWRGLAPGLHTLQVCAPGGVVVVTMTDVRIEEGRPCNDPRLDPLDLTDSFQLLRPRVLHADGEPALGWSLRLQQPDGRWSVPGIGSPGFLLVPRDQPFVAQIRAGNRPPMEWHGGSAPIVLPLANPGR
jgi:hypothetical protein